MARRKSGPQSPANGSSEGIWYYVYLKPNWVLLDDRHENASHLQYWRSKIVPLLCEHYKLDDSAAVALAGLNTSMPRGRVLLDERIYGVYHGNDFPKNLSFDGEIKQIISLFNLSREQLLGRVKVMYDSHETMDPQQKKKVQKIIGRVPY